ncbi:MAG: hypothetical protein AAGE94_14650, partial [Acidobacteriota bacterium]
DADELCSTGPFANTEVVTYAPTPMTHRVTTTGFWVYFGTWATQVKQHFAFHDTVVCDGSTFGNPSIGGAMKCFLYTSGDWKQPMADEGESFQLPIGKTTGTYHRQNGCPTVRPCSNSEFGDPAPYFYKQCTFYDANGHDSTAEHDHFSIHWGPRLNVSINCSNDHAGSPEVRCTANGAGGTEPYTYLWNYFGSAQGWGGQTSRTAYASYYFPGCQPWSTNSFGVTVTDGLGESRYVSLSPFGCP